jgi:hypothetical protein
MRRESDLLVMPLALTHLRVHRELFDEIFLRAFSHFYDGFLASIDAQATLKLVVSEELFCVCRKVFDEAVQLGLWLGLEVSVDNAVQRVSLVDSHALLVVIKAINHRHAVILTSCSRLNRYHGSAGVLYSLLNLFFKPSTC